MKKLIIMTAIAASMGSFGQSQNGNAIHYPQTKKGETVEVYFDTKVADPYRWLEDDK